MISVTYVFETSDEGGAEEVMCTAFINIEEKRKESKEERDAMKYFMDMVKTSCSYEEGMEIQERGE